MQYKLVSVSDKTNVEIICSYFIEQGDKILSTGGTYKYLLDRLPEYRESIIEVSNITKFPEILDTVLNSSSFASAVAKRDDTEFIKMVLEVLSTKVLEYFQESKFYTFINLLSLLIK